MTLKRLLLWLVGGALLLPIAVVLVVALGALLGAMQDEAGRTGLNRAALALGLLWALDLICLLICLGIESSGARDELPNDEG